MAFGKGLALSPVFGKETNMARKPRLEFPGAIYHITHRGNHQEFIYRDDEDRGMMGVRVGIVAEGQ